PAASAPAASAPSGAAPAAAAPVWIAGEPVSAAELWFWLRFADRHQRAQAHPSAAPGPAAAITPAEAARLSQTAVDLARQSSALRAQAAAQGVALTPSDLAPLQQEWDRQRRLYGSVEYRRIVMRMYGAETVMQDLARTDLLGQRLFARLYGERGERCPDAAVADYIHQAGLQHLQYVRVAPGPGAAVQARLQRLQDLARQLRQADDPDALMEQAIATLGEDEAMLQEPQGRVVGAGVLPAAVEAAYQALADGQSSGVVHTPQGAYLLRRLPLHGEVIQGATGKTLRYWAAYNGLFKPQVAAWAQALPVVESPTWQTLDVARLLR
ncbi:hypothetical protein G3A44_03415, partial [Ideonella sp. TBM-1]|nr:hypothetical protein [Ideonella livida]